MLVLSRCSVFRKEAWRSVGLSEGLARVENQIAVRRGDC